VAFEDICAAMALPGISINKANSRTRIELDEILEDKIKSQVLF
jgi:hypothetical protein